MNELDYLQRLAISHMATRILLSGVQLGVFESLNGDAKTAEAIAADTGCARRGIRMLLDCLVSFRLLSKSSQLYSLNSLSSRYLKKSSPDYIGHLWEDESVLRQWDQLNDAIRSGKPFRTKGGLAEEAESFVGLARSLHVVHWEAARRAADILVTESSGMRVLDVACGSGVWGIAIAQSDPRSMITAHDLPAMLQITRTYAERHNVQGQIEYLAGDLRTIDFGRNHYDLAILGNIIHSEGERSARELLERLHPSLKENGRIAIIDIIPDEDRTGPQSSLILALAMLLDTEEGDLFTLAEYKQWLGSAGFTQIETHELGLPSPMIVARKRKHR